MARSRFDFASCLLACAGLALFSCGRTPLRDAPSATGGGGGGAATSSATTSVTGTGTGAGGMGTGGSGGTVPCDVLVLSGPPIVDVAFEPSGYEERRPVLVPSVDGARVAVAFALEPTGAPNMAQPIGHTAIDPWGEWPAAIGSLHFAADIGGRRFAATTGDGGFALLLRVGGGPNPGVFFAPSVAPENDYSPIPDGFLATTANMARPAFAARGASGYLTGSLYEAGPYLQLEITRIAPDGVVPGSDAGSGCATSPMVAGAVPSGDGYLAAFSSGRPFGSCYDDDGVPGPPTEVQVARIEADGAIQGGAVFPGTEPVAAIQVVPRSDGAWLVWHHDGSTSLVPPAILAARLDPEGQLASDIVVIAPDGSAGTYGPFAVGALGDRLAVATVDAFDPSFPTMVLQVFDEDGLLEVATSLSTAPGWFFDSQLAVLGSPAGDQVLLAYASNLDGEPRRIHVARFDCAAGE